MMKGLVYTDIINDGIITVHTEILQESHYYPFGEQGCSSHMKWLVAEVKWSFRPAEDRGAISVVWNLYATAKELQRIGVPGSLHPAVRLRLSLQVQRYRTTQGSGCRDRHGLLQRYGSYYGKMDAGGSEG